jgi:branched-chain amino acid transport system permease protein
VTYFVALVVDGVFAGAIYTLVALAFVVTYKASRLINFALGEWTMVAAGFAGAGFHLLGLGVAGSLAAAAAGMIALGVGLNRLVLRALVGRPLISLIMVTLGLGAVLRGAAFLGLAGVPQRIPLPIPTGPLVAGGLVLSTEKLVTAAVASAAIAGVTWFFHGSRIGLALRAVADDQQVAMAMGIDLQRCFTITWALVGVIAVLAGTLWSVAGSGGFGVVLLGLKVFPIVIIGGLDSIPGTIAGAAFVGVLESLAAGYLDPLLGGGFSHVAAYLVLIAMLFARPYGLFGRAEVARV